MTHIREALRKIVGENFVARMPAVVEAAERAEEARRETGRRTARVIGHPDLADETTVVTVDCRARYVSVGAAVRLILEGKPGVEIHWQPTDEDERALALHRDARRRFFRAASPDGWTGRGTLSARGEAGR